MLGKNFNYYQIYFSVDESALHAVPSSPLDTPEASHSAWTSPTSLVSPQKLPDAHTLMGQDLLRLYQQIRAQSRLLSSPIRATVKSTAGLKEYIVEAQLRIKGWSAAMHADQSVRTRYIR